MYRPLITWAALAALLIILFIARTAIACHRRRCRQHRKHMHIVEIGSERDEFFVPGDRPTYDKSRDYEDF
ncbi:hypothetical protein [Paramuribaculum intestinale]|jgi:hypothetical protein|uniref:hypothetical protein n=1 Tax=Paramuribaculum intestinale TaxID=2094151 RepID=UPI0025A54319|nr:hypothetical protein [Paramuribaculum intestinale]